jgi:hypothetical protein
MCRATSTGSGPVGRDVRAYLPCGSPHEGIGLDFGPKLLYNQAIKPPVSSGTGRETVLSEYGLCLCREGVTVKTWVYIDGFNLYYGAVKGTSCKWLDLQRMCALLLRDHSIARIKYFTARVSARSDDPDKPTRQQIYLRALRTLPDLEIIFGRFLSHDVMMPLAQPVQGGPKFAKVIKTEEKGSDVNIAAHLINDGYKKKYEAAVIVTNDSDLLEPIKIVRKELGMPVGILNPHKNPTSRVLAQHASFVRQIRQGVVVASQFPDELTDAHGRFHKPTSW